MVMRLRKVGLKRQSSIYGLAAAWLSMAIAASGATFTEWQNRQELSVPSAGLIKLSLPIATLDSAQSGLEDLRILDPAGAEVAYALERPRAAGKVVQPPKTFAVSLADRATVIALETGLTQALEGVSLDTPASAFIKAVRVEGSRDGEEWQELARGQPIFRRNGATQLRVPVTGTWAHLRLTIDDQRSEHIPFTGATLHAGESFAPATEALPIAIGERVENPGETRLVLNLGTANLDLVSLWFDTPEPLFTRRVTLAVRQVAENAIREQAIGGGVIYRIALEGQPVSASLALPVERLVPTRELIVLIQNGDSPPLSISGVSGQRRPVYAVFQARQGGSFALLTGNKRAAVPHYDLGELGASFRQVPVSSIEPSAVAPNADFHPAEALPEIADTGAPLDVAAWAFRKPLKPARGGVQQLELDLEVLAHTQADLADLRLVRNGKQVPYILEHTSITRGLAPQVAFANDPGNPKQTRWSLKLPQRGLPVNRLVCETATSLFRRDVRLYEHVPDERGREEAANLGEASWTRTPERNSKLFSLELSRSPVTDSVFLETDNGDNPPVDFGSFQFYYPVTRVLFKSDAAPLELYYGNREALAPSYDLSLIAARVLSADRTTVALGAEERLKSGAWEEHSSAGGSGVAFWGMLAVVVAGLLVVISRLLPKQTAG